MRPPLSLSLAESDLWPGKSFFLLWLLIRRLALGLPTALQISPDCALLFHEDGVCQFTYLEPNEVYGPLTSPGPGRIWALVASSRALTQPAGVFGNGAPFFVIESASPRRSHLQWLQGADSQYFYMKRWSFPEVLQAYVDLPHGCSQQSRFLQPFVPGELAPLRGTPTRAPIRGVRSVHQGASSPYRRPNHLRTYARGTALPVPEGSGRGRSRLRTHGLVSIFQHLYRSLRDL